MTRAEAEALSKEVLSGRCRSYVEAAKQLAAFLASFDGACIHVPTASGYCDCGTVKNREGNDHG